MTERGKADKKEEGRGVTLRGIMRVGKNTRWRQLHSFCTFFRCNKINKN